MRGEASSDGVAGTGGGAVIAGRFAIERAAGAGGMGTVYRAIDRVTGATVALKVPDGDGERMAARALAEADALAALDHPGIVRLVAHGVGVDGRPFLAMEWLEGEDLAARLAREAMGAREAAALGARVAGALAAAHARGVVHRDLKPSNLFLPGGDVAEVKVVDFGIARLRRVGARLTATGALVGTPGYMAPEQASGEREIGPAADVFALGAVLFEALAGRPAFAGAHALAVLSKVLLDEPPRLREVRGDVPDALDALVARMLAKRAEERPGAEEVARELGAMAAGIEGATAAGPAAAGPAITGEEQRLAVVLMVRAGRERAEGEARASGEARAAQEGASGEARTADATETGETHVGELERMRAIVGPMGGRADALAGGGMIATWIGRGAPRDEAARAARAALVARRRFPGAAMALAGGLTEMRGARPLGPVIERAAGLVDGGEGAESGVPIDGVTAGLLDARFEIGGDGIRAVLFGEATPGEEGARLLLGRAVPCVGRERELRALSDLLDECVGEPVARAVLVTGAAGAGKSRVRQELLRLVRLRGDVEVWVAGAEELGAGSPFALVGAAVQRAAGARPGDSPARRQAQIRELVGRRVAEGERARVAVFLGEIAGAPFPAAASPALAAARRDPGLMSAQVRRAFLDLIAAETKARPLLLVLEDLHWGDAPSVTLVDAALAALRDRPVMVLAIARPEVKERFHDLWSGRDVQEIRLGALGRRAAGQLVRHALPDADDALIERLVRRADGNAFYLEELIRAAAAGRGDALPETIAAMVQARLDDLSAEDRRLLRAASTFGEVFWERGALALLGGAARVTPAMERLDALVKREVLVRRPEGRFRGEEELAFRHALLRDGVYAAMTEADRALGHRLAAEWLEAAGEDDPLILAAHHERGGQAGRAAACLLRAAELSLAGSDPGSAIAHAERALALGPDEERLPWVLHAAANASLLAGRLDEAERYVERMLAAAPRGSAAWCIGALGKMQILLGRGDPETIRFGMAASEGVLARAENAGPLVRLLSLLSFFLGLGGAVQVAEQQLARATEVVAAFEASIEPAALCTFHHSRGGLRLNVALDLEGALRDLELAIGHAAAAGDRLQEWTARGVASLALCYLGAHERVEEMIVRMTAEPVPQTGIARAYLALSLAERGAVEEAVRMARQALADAQAWALPFGEAIARHPLAHALLACGEAEAAEREIRAAMALGVPDVMLLGQYRAALAEARLGQGHAEEALAIAREVLAGTGRELRAAWLPATLVEARALLAMGEGERARDVLARAREEISGVAGRIGDEELRAAFVGRGLFTARILELAEREALAGTE